MEKLPQREAKNQKKHELNLVAYVPPAIIYEGRLTIRAGSPAPDEPFGGPPSPFSGPGG
jgi:hypothetical protein